MNYLVADIGYTTGHHDLKMAGPGSPMNDTGKYATTWKKQANGAWKLVVDVFNSSAALPDVNASSDSTQGIE